MPTDFYDVLGAPANPSSEELKRAYRGRVREYHPDVNDHPEGDAQFKLIRKAHDVLSDPAERKDYDRMGHREYVNKQLDDLPRLSVFPELEDAEPTESDSTASESTSDTTTSETSGRGSDSRSGSTETSTNASANRSSGTSQSTTTRTSEKTQSATAGQSTDSAGSTEYGRSTRSERSTGKGRNTNSSRATGSTGSTNSNRSTSSQSANSQTDSTGRASGQTSTGADRSSWDDVTERTAHSGATQPSTASRRRRGLRRWYGVVLLSLLAYLGGIGTYAAPHVETLSGLANGLTAAPVATLSGAFPLPSASAYLLGTVNAAAAGEPGVGLLLLVGVVALPAVVLTAVAQFGQGSAWVYALASLGPVISLAAAAVAPFPTALALVGLVLLPLFSGLGFLVDVGRYLYATR